MTFHVGDEVYISTGNTPEQIAIDFSTLFNKGIIEAVETLNGYTRGVSTIYRVSGMRCLYPVENLRLVEPPVPKTFRVYRDVVARTEDEAVQAVWLPRDNQPNHGLTVEEVS